MTKLKKTIILSLVFCLVTACACALSIQEVSAKSITRKATGSATGNYGAYVKVTAEYTYASNAKLKAGSPSKVKLVSAKPGGNKWWKNVLVRTTVIKTSAAKYNSSKKKYYFTVYCSVKPFDETKPTNVTLDVYLNTPKK